MLHICATSRLKFSNAPLSLSSSAGTWFWEIGFILFPPFEALRPLSAESHRDMMFVTNTFAWHVGAVALISFAVGVSVYRSEVTKNLFYYLYWYEETLSC